LKFTSPHVSLFSSTIPHNHQMAHYNGYNKDQSD
jgi:hypothetical protein